MKKFFRFLMCALLATGFAACSDSDPEPEPVPDPVPPTENQLATPSLVQGTVTETSFVVTWSAIEHADSYVYTINGGDEQTSATTTIVRTGLEAGSTHAIRVKAVSSASGYTDSQWASISITLNSKPMPLHITIDEAGVSAFSIPVTITADDASISYATFIMEKSVYDNTDGSVEAIAKVYIDYWDAYVKTLEPSATWKDVIDQLLLTGNNELEFSVSSGTDYVVYAFGMNLSGEITTDDAAVAFVSTPAITWSNKTVRVRFEEVGPVSMRVICTPDDGISTYYQALLSKSAADTYLAAGQAEFANLIIQEGYETQGEDDSNWNGLSPDTEYSLVIAAIDNTGAIVFVRADQRSAPEAIPDRVESDLFEELLGEWTGTQTIYNETGTGTLTNTFSVTIASEIPSYDRNYRQYNQLVAMVDGWGDLPYYSIEDLIAESFPESQAIAAFGPKIELEIKADGSISIPIAARKTICGYSGYNMFLASANLTAGRLDASLDLVVTLSEENTKLTISCPTSLGSGYYPGLLFNAEEGTYLAVGGPSPIVLTRNSSAASASRMASTHRSVSLKAGLSASKTPKFERVEFKTPAANLAKWNKLGAQNK